MTHTEKGSKILDAFVKDICCCVGKWQSKNIVESLIDEIKLKVGNSKVLLGISGGVDSSVAAALMVEAGYNVIGVTMQLHQSKKVVN